MENKDTTTDQDEDYSEKLEQPEEHQMTEQEQRQRYEEDQYNPKGMH